MAYPYYPTYQPYQFYQPYQYQMAQQPAPQQTQPTPQQTSPAVNQSSIIWISGESEAAMYPIAPNNAVALWAKDGKTIYLKQADATGKPTMTVYDLVERKQDASDTSNSVAPGTDTFATKDELSAVIGAVKGVDSVLSNLKSDIETMKGDLYGLSGRKKISSKKTVEVDEND